MNPTIAQLANLSWGKVFLGMLVAGGVYWAALYDDGSTLQSQYAIASQELADAEKQLKKTKEAVANADKFEREVRDTIEQFTKIVEFMPERASTAEMVTLVTDLAAKSGAKLTKTEPRPGSEKADFYEMYRLNLALEGSFSQIVMFLSYLSRVPRLMTFDKVELTGERTGEQEVAKLAFTGTLVNYRYTKTIKVIDDKTNAAGGASAPKPQ
jgi:Tfp pilus assembly protein PilO